MRQHTEDIDVSHLKARLSLILVLRLRSGLAFVHPMSQKDFLPLGCAWLKVVVTAT